MLPLHLLDDATVEALLSGGSVSPELRPLAGVVQEIRSAADDPVEPTAELARRIVTGDFAGVSPAAVPPRPLAGRPARPRLADISLRARAVAGAALLFTGLTAATAAGALPDAAQERVESIIESVSPITFEKDVEPAPDAVDDADNGGVREADDAGKGKPAETGKPDTPPGKPAETGKPDTPPGKPAETGKPDTPPGKPADPGRSNPPNDQSSDSPASTRGGQPENRPAGPKR